MRRRVLLLLAGLLLAGCDDGVYSATFIFEGQHTFGSGVQLPGDVYVRAGSAEFESGSEVGGSVYIIGGRLLLNGGVGGDVAVLDGDVTLGPEAVVGGDLRLGGGTVQQAGTAVVEGEVVSNMMPVSPEEIAVGWDDRLRVLSAAFFLAVVGGLWAARRPQLLENVGRTAVDSWLAAGAVGLLVALVAPVLLVVMAFTIILLPFVLIVAGLFLLLVAYGFVALGGQLGSWLGQISGRRLGRGWATFWGTLLLMLLFQLPLVGEGLLLGAVVLVLGVMALTRFGLRRYVSSAVMMEEELSAYGRPDNGPF